MRELSLVSQRRVQDTIEDAGGIFNVVLSKQLLNDVRRSRTAYRTMLELEKHSKVISAKAEVLMIYNISVLFLRLHSLSFR
jgi:hypothetical protein